MRKPVYPCAHALVVLSLLGLMGCYSTVEVGDSPADKAVSIDWVDPPCAVPGSEAGYIEGTGFGAENVTIYVGGIAVEVLTATGMDASFVVPAEGLSPGDEIVVVVENPGGRLATIDWRVCEIECDPPNCDDGNECTTDTCDTSDGTCINSPVADGTLCGTDGVCDAGACRERSWGTPVPVSDGSSGSPQLGVDVTGNVVVVWVQQDGGAGTIWANRYTPAGGWGTSERIDDGMITANHARVAVDPNGNAIAVWDQADSASDITIWANRYTPTGGWGTPERLQAPGDRGIEPDVGIDPNGNAMAVWERDSQGADSVWATRFTPAGGWAGVTRISGNDVTDARVARVGLDPSGNTIAVWDTGSDYGIWANRFTPSGGWSVPQLLGSGSIPKVAIDLSGNAFSTWNWWQSSRVWSSRYTPSNGWEAAEALPAPSVGPKGASSPDVAIDPNGNALAVWQQSDSARRHNIWASRFTPTGGWGTAELIEQNNEGSDPSHARVAIDALGNAVAVWSHCAYGGCTGRDIWANRFTPSGGWETPVLVEFDDAGDAGSPELVVDTDGNTIVVWQQSDGARYSIWSNRFE